VGRHPIFARFYNWLSKAMEAGVAEHRDELLADLSGRVVEIGAGNGINFRHYPASVAELVAVEPESYLRKKAVAEAARAPVTVTVMDGSAGRLPLPDSSFDAAVTSLVLCSVPNQTRALAELRRVLRPGGELRFYEHVRAEDPRTARRQERADVVWRHVAGGCHTSRGTLAAIERAGFEIEKVRQFDFPPGRMPNPARPHVIGRARRGR
jgi:ubiquinone/menaquinone biosynthesis C-methylase UbiE